MNPYLIAYCLVKAITILAVIITALIMAHIFAVLLNARFGLPRSW